MGYVTNDPRKAEEQPGGGSGLSMDLDVKACPTCRRELLPWQARCPQDGAAAVDRRTLPTPGLAPPPAHLLADLDGDEDGDEEADGA